jgi:outer membrane protein assembly factor BamB
LVIQNAFVVENSEKIIKILHKNKNFTIIRYSRNMKFQNIYLTLFLVFFTLCTFADESDFVIMAGLNVHGTRDFDSSIRADNVDQLSKYMIGNLCGAITATPTILADRVCVSDYGSCITCFDRQDHSLLWQKHLHDDYDFIPGLSARGTLTYHADSDSFVLGTTIITNLLSRSEGAWMFSISSETGDLNWKYMINAHPYAIITQSFTLEGDYVYFGTSSSESGSTLNVSYACCTFVGESIKADVQTGSIIWRTPFISAEAAAEGYSGVASWGNVPIVMNEVVMFTTGQMYTMPQEDIDCAMNASTEEEAANCIRNDVYFDSVVILDKDNGTIISSFSALPVDIFRVDCYFAGPSCQYPELVFDHDMTTSVYSEKTDRIYALGKDSYARGFDSSLNLLWEHKLIEPSTGGGYQWYGAFHDHEVLNNQRLCGANTNSGFHNWTTSEGEFTTEGAWLCYDGNGNLLWATPALNSSARPGVSITNNLLVGGTDDGKMAFMHLDSGEVLKIFDLEAELSGGSAAISDDCVYKGTGFNGFFQTEPLVNALYKFCL